MLPEGQHGCAEGASGAPAAKQQLAAASVCLQRLQAYGPIGPYASINSPNNSEFNKNNSKILENKHT